MNKPLIDIYEEYRDEMANTLAIEEIDPGRLADPEYFDSFARKVERLDTLIELYASLLASNRN
jgi:hypothetical protein